MFFDDYGAINMEQVPYPGSIGDSCAETCRYNLLYGLTHEQLYSFYQLFVTRNGYLRHPEAPAGWREDDFSSDQAIPLYILFSEYGMKDLTDEFERRLREAGWKTGNGDYVSLLFISAAYRARGEQNSLTDLPILLQAIALRFLPYRWNEVTKSLEHTDGSSCDWLNYYHLLLQARRRGHTIASKLARWLTPHSMIMEKVRDYYSPEPNSKAVIDGYANNPI